MIVYSVYCVQTEDGMRDAHWLLEFRRCSSVLVYQLIVIDVGLFLCFNIFFIFERLIFRSGSIELFYQQYLTLPASLGLLPLRFWTIITYMFLHAGLWHILVNMLFLFFFGRLLEEYIGRKKLISKIGRASCRERVCQYV